MDLKLYIWKLSNGSGWVWDLAQPGAETIRGNWGVVDYGIEDTWAQALALGLAAQEHRCVTGADQ